MNLPANTGDAGSIPGLGRSLGGGAGNPSSILAWEIHGQRGCKRVHGMAKQLDST